VKAYLHNELQNKWTIGEAIDYDRKANGMITFLGEHATVEIASISELIDIDINIEYQLKVARDIEQNLRFLKEIKKNQQEVIESSETIKKQIYSMLRDVTDEINEIMESIY